MSEIKSADPKLSDQLIEHCGCALCEKVVEEMERLRLAMARAVGPLNSIRADLEHTLWPNSGFAEPGSE